MKKCAIYARVSTPEQHVETQLYDLRHLAQQRGFEVVEEYTDNGVRKPGDRGWTPSCPTHESASSPSCSFQHSTGRHVQPGICFS